MGSTLITILTVSLFLVYNTAHTLCSLIHAIGLLMLKVMAPNVKSNGEYFPLY